MDPQRPTMEENYKMIIEQMKKETQEFKADGARMARILSVLHIPSSLSSQASQYAQNLQKACEALDVLMPDETNLMIGISDLHQESEAAEEMLESSQKRIEKYNNQLPELLTKREKWQRNLEKLKSEQDAKEKESLKVTKSTHYMTKKIGQYEDQVQRAEQSLASAGYEDSLSHEVLVKLGSEVREMEEQLKPLKLQLNSYKDLPPNLIEAQIKLEEKRLESKRVEKDVADKLGEISIMQIPADA